MKITIKTVSKEEHAVELSAPSATVGELKKAACEKMSIAPGSALTLVHLGTVLSDDSKTMADNGIADGAMLVAVIKKPKTIDAASSAASETVTAAPAAAPAPASDTAPAPAPAAADPMQTGETKTIRLTVSDIEGDVRIVEVDDNETVENVKAVLEVEFAIPLAQQVLFFEAKQLQNTQRLNAIGVKNDDMLMIQKAAPRPGSAVQRQGVGGGPGGLNLMGLLGGSVGGGAASARSNPLQAHMGEANQILQMAASDPHFVRRIQENNKQLADAIAIGKPEEVAKELLEIQKIKKENDFKKQQAIMRLNADPFDVEAQREIEEMLRMENVNNNLEQAMEYNPEAFARVVMLYVDCEVNGVPIKAFVDSGAQSTIMSQLTAERLGIMRLIDYRYAGIAKGVGTSKIVGRVHAVQMKMGSMFITVSITVLEDNSMEFLFGLDNLRRHQMSIDLKDNVLKCEGMSVPFLGEGDLPKHLMGMDDGGGSDAMDVEQAGASAGGASGSSAGAQPSGSQAGGDGDIPASAIEALTGMGFTREQALTALKSCGGNPELAASLLFGGD